MMKSRRWWSGWIAALTLMLVSAAPAAAQSRCGDTPLRGDRVALLIGNSDYNEFEWPSLANAVHDIDHVCAAFAQVGFSPRVVRNADHAQLTQALAGFAREARGARQVVIYYAGHGFEYAGRNWLVPMDAPPLARRNDVDSRFVSIETLVGAVVPPDAFALLFIDACRTSEPVVRLADAQATDGDAVAPLGLLALTQGAVFYSTAKGRPALDAAPDGSLLSPFAAAVVRQLGIPGLEIGHYFKVVSRDVYKTTRDLKLGPQTPFHYGSWFDDVYLVPPPELAANALTAASVPLPARIEGLSLDRLAIEDEPVLIADVLSRYPAEQLLAMADRGDSLAQHLVGYMLHLGVGVRRDVARAKAYLEKSAAAGFAAGQQELAWLLLENDPSAADVARAQSLYEAAAAQGFSKAKTHLAYRLTTGIFGTTDFVRAEQLYAEAAAAGHPAAMFALTFFAGRAQVNLARLRDLSASGNSEGNHWLCEAAFAAGALAGATEDCAIGARAGFAGSRALLAYAYASGQGVATDAKEARHWARLARSLPELRADQRALIAAIPE